LNEFNPVAEACTQYRPETSPDRLCRAMPGALPSNAWWWAGRFAVCYWKTRSFEQQST